MVSPASVVRPAETGRGSPRSGAHIPHSSRRLLAEARGLPRVFGRSLAGFRTDKHWLLDHAARGGRLHVPNSRPPFASSTRTVTGNSTASSLFFFGAAVLALAASSNTWEATCIIVRTFHRRMPPRGQDPSRTPRSNLLSARAISELSTEGVRAYRNGRLRHHVLRTPASFPS
jgi:hypothetical protein